MTYNCKNKIVPINWSVQYNYNLNFLVYAHTRYSITITHFKKQEDTIHLRTETLQVLFTCSVMRTEKLRYFLLILVPRVMKRNK